MFLDISYEFYKNYRIIKFKFLDKFTEEDFKKFLTVIDTFLKGSEKFCILIDGLDCKSIHIKYSLILSRWMKERREQIPHNIICSTLSIKNSSASRLIKIAFSIQKPQNPFKVTNNLEDSIKFIHKNIDNTLLH